MTGPSHHRALRGGAAAGVGLRYPRECFRLDVARCAARTADAHEEVAERVIEFRDVRQHAHGLMVADRIQARPCSAVARAALYMIIRRSQGGASLVRLRCMALLAIDARARPFS